jgi:hypothetical protein
MTLSLQLVAPFTEALRLSGPPAEVRDGGFAASPLIVGAACADE